MLEDCGNAKCAVHNFSPQGDYNLAGRICIEKILIKCSAKIPESIFLIAVVYFPYNSLKRKENVLRPHCHQNNSHYCQRPTGGN